MFNKRNLAAGAFIASVANADTNGLFGVFDTDKNGTIEPTEVYAAYKQMDSKDDNRLSRTEFMKTMDGHVRSFCGVQSATKADMIKMDEDKERLIAFAAPSLVAHMNPKEDDPEEEDYGMEDFSDEEMRKFEALDGEDLKHVEQEMAAADEESNDEDNDADDHWEQSEGESDGGRRL
jgi:hypothetical protein